MSTPTKQVDLRLSETVGVTSHALEKLRERQPAGSQYSSLADKELRALLERAWRQGREAKSIELWWERNEAGVVVCNYVVELGVLSEDLLGLVREDDRTPGRPCFITVITKPMAERSKSNNRWARSPEKVGAPGLLNNTLAQQLEGVTVQPKGVPAKPIEKMVVTWVSEGKLRFQAIPKDTLAVGNLIHQLLQDGVDEKTIEFWVRSSAKIRRQITVDFDE